MTVTERFDWGIDRDTEGATWSRRIAGVLFAGAAGWFVTALMIAAALVPGYATRSGAISELGVASESAIAFNLSLLAVGLLTVGGGYLFYRSHDTPWLLASFALAGVGAAGAAVFTANFGPLHALFALLAGVFYNVAAIGTGVRIRGPMVVVSVLLGAVGLLFVVLLPVGGAGGAGVLAPIGPGGAERLVVYPAMLWLLVFGGYLLGSRRNVTIDPRTGDGD